MVENRIQQVECRVCATLFNPLKETHWKYGGHHFCSRCRLARWKVKEEFNTNAKTLFVAMGRWTRYAVIYKPTWEELDYIAEQAIADAQGFGINK